MPALFRFPSLLALVLAATLLSACATGSQQAATTPEPPVTDIADPFEGYNRAIFAFNNAIDEALLVPLVKGYRAVFPKPVRTGVHNVLNNLRSPITIGNQMLQGDLKGTGDATVRLAVNTLIGVGGIFDVAAMEGIADEPEDFGQTLAVWGVGHGPYIVPPLLAPASLRDQTGYLADSFADPVRLWLHNTDREGIYYTKLGLTLFDQRNGLIDTLADLKRNSIDYYATIRSAYVQHRAAQVRDQAEGADAPVADIPNYNKH